MNQIGHNLRGAETGNFGPGMDIFGGKAGNQFWGNLQDMFSGKAATDITGAIQAQMAPQYMMQLDKLMQTLNPALRGSGIGAQMGKDLLSAGNQDMASILAGLRSDMFTQGTGMLGRAQTNQVGMNANMLNALRQLMGSLVTTGSESSGSQWGIGSQSDDNDIVKLLAAL